MARMGIGGRRRKKDISTHKMTVRRGDRVMVMRGNYAGTEGTVLRVLPQENKVVVEGVNQRKRHMRPTQDNPEGGIVTFEAPFWLPGGVAPGSLAKRFELRPVGALVLVVVYLSFTVCLNWGLATATAATASISAVTAAPIRYFLRTYSS